MIFWMAALLLVAAVAAAASPEAPDSLIQTPSGVVAAPGGHPASAQEAAAIAKRAWQDLQGGWGKRAWQDLQSGWGKRGWQELQGGWGKRGWQTLQPMWGKRAPWERFHGSWGKRLDGVDFESDPALATALLASYDSAESDEDMGADGPLSAEEKRAWSHLHGAWGKRGSDWSNFRGSWGKREPAKWSSLNGLWGKRGPSNWNRLSAVWGKRAADGGIQRPMAASLEE